MFMTMFITPDLAASNPNPNPADPVADSILKQQRDTMLFQLNLDFLNAVNDRKTPYEVITIIEEILEIDPQQHNQWFNLGIEFIKIHEYYKAIDALTQGLDVYPTEDKSTLCQVYISLSFCYNKIEKHQKEKEILDIASQLFPDHPGIIGRYVICAHSRMRFHEAEDHLEQLTLELRKEGFNEAEIAFHMGRLYLTTDILVAEKHFRVAYYYNPEDVEKQGALAWVLIQNALRIDEGMTLMREAIESDPDNAAFIHQLGYGFFVKGEYETALDNLYNARELYQEYSYELDNHIRMVEEALASQVK